MKNSDKIILDLCGGTGAWSKPYKDAGYDLRLITLPNNSVTNWFWDIDRENIVFPGININGSKSKDVVINAKHIYGILSAPPCTQFSFARTNAKEMRDFRGGIKIVISCLDIILQLQYEPISNNAKYTRLKFWALENPHRGLLKNFLGKPPFIFNPYEFGDEYKKETALWGNFNFPKTIQEKADPKLFPKFDYMKSKDIHPEKFGELDRQARRAITPAGFARAFYQANR